jgi:hypothetical protein
MKETELAQKFINHFIDFDLYFEVGSPVGSTDIVAVKSPLMISIEVKTSFGLSVIEQAVRNIPYYHYSYVAVPYVKDSHFAEQICKQYGIGVLKYKEDNRFSEFEGHVYEQLPPKFNRKALAKYIKLMDAYKDATPGCVNGRPTPFKEMIKGISAYLQRHPGATLKEVFEGSYITYRTISAFKAGMYQWIRNDVIKEFYIDNGKLYLK